MDKQLAELNELNNSLTKENLQKTQSDIYINILWTTLATSLIYFILVHKNN
jgi:hypothetical protein